MAGLELGEMALVRRETARSRAGRGHAWRKGWPRSMSEKRLSLCTYIEVTVLGINEMTVSLPLQPWPTLTACGRGSGCALRSTKKEAEIACVCVTNKE